MYTARHHIEYSMGDDDGDVKVYREVFNVTTQNAGALNVTGGGGIDNQNTLHQQDGKS